MSQQYRVEPAGTPQHPPSPPPADASLGELVKAMSADLSRLVRNEIQLAQTEISAKIKTAGIGVGAFGGAGVLALYGLGVLIAAAVLGLALVLPAWLAALIVGIVVLAIAGVAALVGKKKLERGRTGGARADRGEREGRRGRDQGEHSAMTEPTTPPPPRTRRSTRSRPTSPPPGSGWPSRSTRSPTR